MALPTSGAAWSALVNRSNQSAGSPSVSDQDDPDNVTALAKALVAARTGDATKRAQVVSALQAVQGSSVDRALALGRELGAYVLAADLIGYRDPAFVAWVSRMRTVATSGGPSSLIRCHDERPNNWGTHCGASRVIADLYLGDTADLALAVKTWRGWLGDRSQYAGFSYGDKSWQCNPSAPVGINPLACERYGVSLDGVLPDDQRRGGSYSPGDKCENYVHEALQGVTLTGAVLHRAGYPFWTWSDRAVARAYERLYETWDCPATGDDTFATFISDHFAQTSLSGDPPSNPGKNFGFSDWLWP